MPGKRKKNPVYAANQVRQMDQIESLTFGKLDAEMRCHRQAVMLKEFEIERAQQQLAGLKALVERTKPEYMILISELSKKYRIPKDRLIIDPDLGTIRDSKKDL